MNHVPLTQFRLKQATFARIMRRNCLSMTDFARTLGVSRSHWTLVYHHKRPLAVRTRRRILDCPLMAGIAENRLWSLIPPKKVSP